MRRYATLLAVCVGLPLVAAVRQPVPGVTPAQREQAYRANNVGVAHLEQFDYKGAEQSFRQALERHPALALARLNLAIALFYSGRAGEAAVEARAAAALLPESPQTHYVLGLAARGEDNLDEAVAAFERVVKLDGEDAGAKIQLGQIFLQQRRYDEALRLFQEALSAEPYNVTAAYSVALALTRSGKPEEGRAAMQRFEALRDSPYGFTYAQTYLAQGKYAEAIASTGAEPELVDTSLPAVTFADATTTMMASGPGPARGSAGQVTLFDADADGDLDVADADGSGLRFLRNRGAGSFADETSRVGLDAAPLKTARLALAGDYDNDDRLDLFLIAAGEYHLLRQRQDGGFENITKAAALPAPPKDGGGAAAAAADVDHDGDLDLVIGGTPSQLLRNAGKAVFAEIGGAAGLASLGTVSAIVATDYDNRRDIDFLAIASGGPVLYRNMRDGTFRVQTAEAGLPERAAYDAALAVGDVNKDGYVDFFFSRADASGILAMSDGRTRFRAAPAPEGTRGAAAARFLDYDNDGLLDLLVAGSAGLRLFRHAGGAWTDATERARISAALPASATSGIESLGVGDLDEDGDADVVVRQGGTLRFLRNDGGNRHASLRLRLVARVSNRHGIGSKVEMRAGSLRQMLETSSSSPAVAPADLAFGLGARQQPDVARVLWPSGILQAETAFETGAPKGRRGITTITELDRKPSSCPYLFTWNGSRFEFVTDVMGGGEMGAWLGPSLWNQPDPDEYVRIRGDQLAPRAGAYELRLTNELEEALFFDRAELVAIDHPAGADVFPNEGLRSAPRPPFAVTAVHQAAPPVRARDEHGHDVLPHLTALDRRYPDDFARLPIRGYAEPHDLVLDLGRAARRPVLLLTGWTDYAFSSDNVAASQSRVEMQPPFLQVRDSRGQWQTAVAEIGFPVGRPQTVVVDLEGKFLSPSREVRIVTNMRIYWDQVLVADRAPDDAVRTRRLGPAAADLRWRGLSAEVTPDGREPYGYDYARVSASMPWKVLAGRYTREGDVRPLLNQVDDLFVISQPGDELALSFRALPPPAAGERRTFLLYVHGYSKEMNPRSAVPDTVAPLPFRAMSGYPYGPREHYPRTGEHRAYQEHYNTRIVTRSVPSIERAIIGERR